MKYPKHLVQKAMGDVMSIRKRVIGGQVTKLKPHQNHGDVQIGHKKTPDPEDVQSPNDTKNPDAPADMGQDEWDTIRRMYEEDDTPDTSISRKGKKG